jgi:hypothetical protein
MTVNIKIRGLWNMKSVTFWSDVTVGTEPTASSAEIENAGSYETSVCTCQTTRHHILDNLKGIDP